MIMLWTGAVYLVREGRFHWIATLPATFMTAVSVTYILQAPEGLRLPTSVSYPVGLTVALLTFVYFLLKARQNIPSIELQE